MSKKFLFVNTDADYEESPGAYEESDFINSSSGAADAGKPIVLDSTGKLDPSFYDFGDIDHGSLSGLGDDDHTQYSLADGSRDYTGIVSYDSHPNFTVDEQIVDKKYVDDAISTAGASAEWFDSAIDMYDPTSGLPGSPSTGDRYLSTATANGWTTDYVYEWNGSSWAEQIPTTGTYISIDDETDGLYYYGGSSWVKKYYENSTASLGVKKVGVDFEADLVVSGGINLSTNSMYVDPDVLAGEGLTTSGSTPTKDFAIDWSTAFNDSKAIKASDLSSNSNGFGASIIGIEDSGALIAATDVEGALAENRTAIDAIEDNTITSPNSTISVGGTIGGDDQTVDISWSTTFNDAKAVKAEDLNSTVSGEGASIIGIYDAGGYTTTTNVEDAIQEIYGKINGYGTTYTVGTGGVNKGDLVYISANDTVLPYGTITATQYCIGLAAIAQSAGNQVKVLGNDNIITGILSGATAGTRYYWNGSGWTTTPPSTSSQHVWLGGIAKNSTDLQIEVRYIKKNA